MIFTAEIIEELEKVDPQTRSVLIKILKLIEKAIGEVVKREDFLELKKEVQKLAENVVNLTKIITELAEAQKKAEERLSRLETTVGELTETQKRAEERLSKLETTVAELAEAQKQTEIKIAELAEAQKRAEERLSRLETTVAELAEAQKRTEIRLNELAEAQNKTEKALQKLIEDHRKTRENLGGLAHTVGYFLENEAYKYLPNLLKKDFSIEVIGEILRDYVEISPLNYEEINILGKGRMNGKEITIFGEAKTQLKKTDVDRFISKINKIAKIYPTEKLLILVTHQAHPSVREYAKQKGIKIYYSYQFK